jgi:mannose-1-phosphate guanylyltransferase/mannose-1-phosphate guanylyltransferase/phosphomannomutase
MKAVILAAGKGTRLAPYSDILPKPLMPVALDASGAFVPIIDLLIRQIVRAGADSIVVAVNYLSDLIVRHLGDGSRFGVPIAYVYQETLDGNAGAFYRAQALVAGDDVIVTDADNYLSDDGVFQAMAAAHRAAGAACTVAVSRVADVRKFAIIKTDAAGRPTDIFEKPADAAEWGNLAKSGMMILSASLAALDKSISLTDKGEYATTMIIKQCLKAGLPVVLHELKSGFNDIGTWPEYLGVLRRNLG